MITLRPYQSLALSTLWDYLRHRDGNPALVLPTGAGKSPLMAAIADEAVTQWGGRICILAHVQELVSQNADKLHQYAPHADVGIYAAGLRRRDRFNQILVCQIQSVYDRAHALGRFDLILVDEAHRIPLNGEGRYRRFIAECRRFNPNLRVVGLTATPYRLQGQAVPVCGPEHILTEVAYEARVGDLIAEGYLSPLVSTRGGVSADLSAVHTRGGEYVEGELSAAMRAGDLVQRTVTDLLARAEGRKAGIVFCVDVAHAEDVLFELMDAGEAAGLVHGKTPKGERAELIGQFQAGALRWIVNVNVLSEGFDAPHIDCVAMLRPTKSPGLYYQQVGRGFRLAPGKVDCLVLDYAGNVLEHGPVDAIRVRQARQGKAAAVETARAKECPCGALLPLGVRQCPECGHVFGSLDPAHSDRPIDAPVLSAQRERRVNTLPVRDVAYSVHRKPGKVPSLRVTYQCGLRQVSEWVCLQHAGVARARALQWWQKRSSGPVPRSIDEAMLTVYQLPKPAQVVVDDTDKYPQVLDCVFEERDRAAAQEVKPNPRAPQWLREAIERSAA